MRVGKASMEVIKSISSPAYVNPSIILGAVFGCGAVGDTIR